MPLSFPRISCCGMQVMDHLYSMGTSEATLRSITRLGYHQKAIITFTQAFYPNSPITEDNRDKWNMNYGNLFTAFIRANKLGVVRKSRKVLNTNSMNDICLFVWFPDRAAITEWLAKNPAPIRPPTYERF